MHELAQCHGIVESVERHRKGRTVYKVIVRVGFLRQIVPESMAFAWELLTSGTPLDGAKLEIDDVPATVACDGCGANTTLEVPILMCASCGGGGVRVVTGDELIVVSLELAAT